MFVIFHLTLLMMFKTLQTQFQVKFVNIKLGEDVVDGKVLLICMQVCSLLARVCFGPIADIEIVRRNRILLQQVNGNES